MRYYLSCNLGVDDLERNNCTFGCESKADLITSTSNMGGVFICDNKDHTYTFWEKADRVVFTSSLISCIYLLGRTLHSLWTSRHQKTPR